MNVFRASFDAATVGVPLFPLLPCRGGAPLRLRLAGFTSGVLLSGRGNRGPEEEAFGEDFRGFRRNFAGGESGTAEV